MGSFSDNLEAKILDHIFRTTKWASGGTTLYVGLATSAIVDGDTGSTVAEANYTGYTRIQKDAGDSNWARTGSTISNNVVVAFPVCTAGSSACTYFFVADAPTAGQIVGHGTLTVAKTVTAGDTPSFAVGTLTCSLD